LIVLHFALLPTAVHFSSFLLQSEYLAVLICQVPSLNYVNMKSQKTYVWEKQNVIGQNRN